jgi:ribonuclease HI
MNEIKEALCVDAACSGNPGPMEYRGVHLPSGKEVFRFGPIQGTNNIGEFLAIVHALALMEQRGIRMPIYSDSVSGQAWVRNKKAKTTLARTPETEKALDLVARAENWLRTHQVNVPILKWDTENWGEIPADFGRK